MWGLWCLFMGLVYFVWLGFFSQDKPKTLNTYLLWRIVLQLVIRVCLPQRHSVACSFSCGTFLARKQ